MTAVDETERELKPCPFCGMTPVFQDFKDGNAIGCVCPEGSPCRGSKLFLCFDTNSRESAIAAWNTRADAAEIAALRKDAERLDWLDSHEYDVVCHVETWCCEEGEYSIWWNVTDGEKSISGHPMGSARDAIDAAIALRTSPPDDQRGTK